MKKIIKLTEEDLARIVRRVIKEQTDGGNINDELNARMESYKNKMDRFLDELKSSGTEIDGKRFLTKVRNETDQIFWELDETSNVPLTLFSQLQLDLISYFREKLRN
jgi:hypothetical protein